MIWRSLRMTYLVILGVLILGVAARPAAEPARSTTGGTRLGSASFAGRKAGMLLPPRGTMKVSNTYSTTVDLTIDDPSGPIPDAELEPNALHGPAVIEYAKRDASVPFPCSASIQDNDGYFNDFTIDMHLFDPNGNEIQPAPSPRWTSTKPSLSMNNTWTQTDPMEGVYTCRAEFWVYGTSLGYSTSQKTLTYSIPTDEQTVPNAWAGCPNCATVYKWRGVVSGAAPSYGGRIVTEYGGGNPYDDCTFPTSIIDPPSLSGGSWTIDPSNNYGDDGVGFTETSVTYLRANGKSGCRQEIDQDMRINVPHGTDTHYKTNRLKYGLTATTVWSQRGSAAPVSKDWTP